MCLCARVCVSERLWTENARFFDSGGCEDLVNMRFMNLVDKFGTGFICCVSEASSTVYVLWRFLRFSYHIVEYQTRENDIRSSRQTPTKILLFYKTLILIIIALKDFSRENKLKLYMCYLEYFSYI